MTAESPPRRALAIVAHRGASGYAPENTLSAFRKALEMGAAAMEFDVQQAKDGRLVVIHDLDLRRVAGVRRSVRSMTADEIRAHEVGSWFGESFRGEKVPLLEEVLELAPPRGRVLELHLEIKNGLRPYEGIERRVLELLGARKEWSGRVVVSSFDHKALRRVRELEAGIRLGYLAGATRLAAALREARELGCESVHLSLRRVDAAWVQAAHAAGFKVLVYTVNDPEEGRRAAAMGVDGVFSNFPDLAVPAGAGGPPALRDAARGR